MRAGVCVRRVGWFVFRCAQWSSRAGGGRDWIGIVQEGEEVGERERDNGRE